MAIILKILKIENIPCQHRAFPCLNCKWDRSTGSCMTYGLYICVIFLTVKGESCLFPSLFLGFHSKSLYCCQKLVEEEMGRGKVVAPGYELWKPSSSFTSDVVPLCVWWKHRCREYRFNPWVGKIPWSREWQTTLVFLPGNSMDRGAWKATVHGVIKSQTWLSTWAHTHVHSSTLRNMVTASS